MIRIQKYHFYVILHGNFRLDFLDFDMDGGSAEDKPCDRDSMEIFSAGTAELGINKLCGKNENQHIYIPVESAQV